MGAPSLRGDFASESRIVTALVGTNNYLGIFMELATGSRVSCGWPPPRPDNQWLPGNDRKHISIRGLRGDLY